MDNVRVKICGLTNLDDAITATEAGADMLGFILYDKSKRAVSADAVRCMVSHLRSLPNCPTLVGVMVNRGATEAADLLDHCELDLAQLHGNEPAIYLNKTESPLYGRAYKALRPATLDNVAPLFRQFVPSEATPLLVDAHHPTEWGGTGLTGDWAIAAHLAQQWSRLMLAGGLTPDNVAQAIEEVRPWAVDVASGTEASPGQKDPDKLFAFVRNAKAARSAA